MSQEAELKKGMEKILKEFCENQEQVEKLVFDALNLSDLLCNTLEKARCSLEQEEKEKALLDTRECLAVVLGQAARLNETIHNSEAAFANQIEAIEDIQTAVDFLCCDWKD